MKILLIEDDISMADTIVEVMLLEGHSAVWVQSGTEAVTSWLNHGGFDTVVSDWDLGPYDARNGGEIVEMLRELRVAARYIIWSGLDRIVPKGVEFFDKAQLPELMDALNG